MVDIVKVRGSESEVESELNRALVAARLKGGAIVVDRNFKVVMIDRKAARYCGVSPGQSQGKRLYSLFSSLLGSRFATELHEVVTLSGTRKCARPADNELLDQLAEALHQDSASLQDVTLKSYRDGRANYCLIQLGMAEDNALEAGVIGSTRVVDALNAAAGTSQAKALLDNKAIYLVTDNYGFICDLSKAAETHFGYQRDVLVGSSIRTLFPGLDELENMRLIDNLRYLAEQHSQSYLQATTASGENRFLDVQVFQAAAREGELIILCRDHTNSTSAIQELVNRGQLFDITARHVADGVVLVDAEGFITEMNPVAEQLLNFKMDGARAARFQVVMPLVSEETGSYVNPVEESILSGANAESHEHLVLKVRGADPMSISLSAYPLRDSLGRVDRCLAIFRPWSEARRVASRLTWQSMHDVLTGLPNRMALSRAIQKAIDSAHLERQVHALLYVDLYHFSVINDTSGHAAGDEMLRQFARLLVQAVDPGDMAARIGNDEFGILMHNVDSERAISFAHDLLDIVKELSVPWEGESLRVAASIGGIMIDSDAESDIDMMISAGASCATAKERGRNKVHFHSFSEEFAVRRKMASAMPKIISALEDDRFVLFGQPIVSADHTRGIKPYYEVLVRMRTENGAILPPGNFIPAAEHYSLIDDIDKVVLRKVLSFLRRLNDQGVANIPKLSVNLSGVTIGDENCRDFILREFESSQVSPEFIQFEITETAAVKHIDGAKGLIGALRAVGASFALDDFGSGLSSFGYLKELPIDCLKIDMSFVHTMENSDVDYSVVSTINHLGHIMGVTTVAEGVETELQLDLLRSIGVDYVQGYYLSKPELLDKIVRR